MSGRTAIRLCGLSAAMALLTLAPRAGAFEFGEDGQFQVHGYGEVQMRVLADDYDSASDWDLAQWYNILNVEAEWEVAPDGWGPFDLVSVFGRAEVRYDCVWSRGCGIFHKANAYGDRSRRLPQRFINARRGGATGSNWVNDQRRYGGVTRDKLAANQKTQPIGNLRRPAFLDQVPGFTALANNAGFDGSVNTKDDPFNYVFEQFYAPDGSGRDSYRFGLRRIKGTNFGVGTQIMPWRPRNKIIPIGALADRANPLRTEDLHPTFTETGLERDNDIPGSFTPLAGQGALPFRQVPNYDFDAGQPLDMGARGLFIPNHELAEIMRDGDFDAFDQNFRQAELEWNHGASQQDEKELKELYIDLEMFDGRLWGRIGRQQIVWGKTELFRTTDQFNPQDLALASLPSLEESRIALWAARFVWSFYDVGPLEDVRFEVAFNFDQFEPADLGRCGEAFTPNPVCNKTTGLFAHGLTGAGLAGEVRPPNPWNSWKGLEIGARLEFRWDRFSFQISEFYGYNDFPYADQLFAYERNVDPETGRPRIAQSRQNCGHGDEVQAASRTGVNYTVLEADGSGCLSPGQESLEYHSANQQLFAVVCANTLFFAATLDPLACGVNVFNSQRNPLAGSPLTIAGALSSLIGGTLQGQTAVFPLLAGISGAGLLVPLNQDPNDGANFSPAPGFGRSMDSLLTDEQEALLGCGPYFGTICGLDGVDLMNMEASALLQSWPGFEGTGNNPNRLWDATTASLSQPGTEGFLGGPVCTRYENGKTYILPGCRGPEDDGYDIEVDGSTEADGFGVGAHNNTLRHPFTNQQFATEMAAVSWNALMGFTALSGVGDTDKTPFANFDPNNSFAKDKCSFRHPQLCSAVAAAIGLAGVQRNVVRAGGNGVYGRRDFTWHGGSSVVLRYEKRNVVGLAVDFAEDVTKSNWGVEFTYIEELPTTDNNKFDGLADIDTFNLTVSVDRPTFINFLNQGRTFFFNSQWFFQWAKNWDRGFTSNGPWSILGTFTVQTGFFQDRLLISSTAVYDVKSASGALLPSFTYRYTENFSVQFGLAFFWGHTQRKAQALIGAGPLGNQAGDGAYRSYVENGLAVVRDRDEMFVRFRYTF